MNDCGLPHKHIPYTVPRPCSQWVAGPLRAHISMPACPCIHLARPTPLCNSPTTATHRPTLLTVAGPHTIYPYHIPTPYTIDPYPHKTPSPPHTQAHALTWRVAVHGACQRLHLALHCHSCTRERWGRVCVCARARAVFDAFIWLSMPTAAHNG